MQELREKIAEIVKTSFFGHSQDEADISKRIADQILSLINAERCVWTYDDWQIHGQDVYKTSCDMFEFYEGYTYCPKCGKRIEVKE
jgi:NADH pyrophosphatase NudC (nudix superfamily)